VRAIRFMVASEYEATQMYMQLAESTENKLAVAVLKDIADRRSVFIAGEFLKLLYTRLRPTKRRSMPRGLKKWQKWRNRNFSDNVGSGRNSSCFAPGLNCSSRGVLPCGCSRCKLVPALHDRGDS